MYRIWQWIQDKYFVKAVDPVVSGLVKPGMKVWECDMTTCDIVEAKIIEVTRVNYFVGELTSKEIVMRPNCMYEVALNGENAVKKFENRIIKLTSK